uniref:Carbonic anhydrase 6 n=1 Tax=Sus scrofa TaxID=9823 RepID=A0A4X1W7S7_PIG
MTALVTLLFLLLLGAQTQHGAEWTYSDGELDEAHWSREYPDCDGRRQSPIDVQRKSVQYNPALRALSLTGYEAQEGEFSMINNGHTVQISLPSTMRLTAPDGTQYIAKQMHFHWGGAFSEISGSEHTIDGIRYVTETVLVRGPGPVTTALLLLQIKDYAENTYYSDFISHLKNIRIPGQTTVLSSLNLQDMLPENLHSYYSYQGSLTTPPCTENVHWFVLADTVKLSRTQVWKLQNSLLNDQNKTIHNDYRRTQPLNHRVVEANFKSLPNPRSELHFYLNNIDNNLEYLRRVIEQKKAKGKGPW